MPTQPTQLPAPRLDSLTGARFVAASGVFLYHASEVFPAGGVFGRALRFVGEFGGIGVDFFFALSGFVLAWSWRPGTPIGSFYRRRFARIAPAYWVALLYGLVWVVVLYREPVLASVRAIPAALGIQAWFPDPAVHFAANGVEWSVSAELFFYALFPVLIGIAAVRRGRMVLLVAAIVLGCVAPFVLPALVPASAEGWVTNILPVVRLGEFVAGLLLAVAMQRGLTPRVGPWAASAVFLIAYVVVPRTPVWVPKRALLLAAILLVIAALAQADVRGRGTLLARGLPVRLGVWSYCFYLVHQMTTQIMLFVVARLVPGAALGPVWLVAAFLVSTLLAAGLYLLVERPFELRLRGPRRTAPKPGATAEPAQASASRPNRAE